MHKLFMKACEKHEIADATKHADHVALFYLDMMRKINDMQQKVQSFEQSIDFIS